MSFNIRNYVSDDHIESIGEIARGQANIIQALSLDNSQKDKEIERLNNIINGIEQFLEEIKDRVIMYSIDDDTYKTTNLYRDIKLKIKELKGSGKEWMKNKKKNGTKLSLENN